MWKGKQKFPSTSLNPIHPRDNAVIHKNRVINSITSYITPTANWKGSSVRFPVHCDARMTSHDTWRLASRGTVAQNKGEKGVKEGRNADELWSMQADGVTGTNDLGSA